MAKGKSGNGHDERHGETMSMLNKIAAEVARIAAELTAFKVEMREFQVETRTLLRHVSERLDSALFLTGSHYKELDLRVKAIEDKA